MKDTLRIVELLEGQIERLSEEGIYEIERDLLLERLRGVYASVLALEAMAEEDRVLDALMGVALAAEDGEEAEPEIEVERIYPAEESEVEEERDYPTEEPEPLCMYGCPPAEYEEELADEPAEEEFVEEPTEEEFIEEPTEEAEDNGPIYFTSPEEAEEPEVEPEPAEEEPEVESEPEVEEDAEPEVEPEPIVMAEIDHRKAMSLYDDDDDDDDDSPVLYVDDEEEEDIEAEDAPEEVGCEPEPLTEEPAEEPRGERVVLGDVIPSAPKTLADQLAEQGVTEKAATSSLSSTIGLNDKYILMRDLFAGDNEYYEASIAKLDEFDTLDEAMLYIYDNFHWAPNSEGARLLMELLARKLF